MNHEAVREKINIWLEPARKKFIRTVDHSDTLRRVLLVLTNAAGCALMLAPVIALLGCSASALYMLDGILGPLDWFLVELLSAAGLLSAFLSVQLYSTRPGIPAGVHLTSQQAPELFEQLQRCAADSGVRPVDRVVLTSDAELRIQATPRWPVPLFHRYTLRIGAPLMFFVSPDQLQLSLAGAFSATARTRSRVFGWALQSSEDWPAIIQALEARPSLLADLMLKPVRWIARTSEILSQEFLSDRQKRQTQWILERTDETEAVDYLANQVVAASYLLKRYWPMILKAAERCASPVVKPFVNFEALLEKNLPEHSVKRWLLQAQASNESERQGLRDLLEDLGIDHLQWKGLPERNAFHDIFDSTEILTSLDKHWQQEIVPEWDQIHASFAREKARFHQLEKRAHEQNLRGASALRYVQLVGRFLERDRAISIYRKSYQFNLDNAAMCFASGREMLLAGCLQEGCEALLRAAELDKTLASRAHTLIDEHQQDATIHREADGLITQIA